MKYTIEEVLNEKQAKEFLLLPVSLYKNDENWVRPLDNDITKVFDPAKNPFFKQKTAYEITERDWSSDVCSSDLHSYKGIQVATKILLLAFRSKPLQ